MTTVLIAIFVTVFDQLVKWIVVSHMELGETIPLIRNIFHLTYILNPGAAFGLLPHQDWFFLAIVAVLFAAFFVMRKRIPGKPFYFPAAVGMLLGGALGNGIDPLEVIDKYGADALRYTLITGNAPGNDMRFYWERVEASRNFANKVWNASRFIMMNDPDNKIKATDEKPANLTAADKWILSKMNSLIKEVTDNMEKYDLGIAVAKLNDFIWEEFCDWYIEMVKPRLYNDEDTT